MHPANPVAAATHPDPYPYYESLLKGPALFYDPSLGLWVASRAAVLREVFEHPACLVRPPGEVVPRALAGSSAGAVFAQLVRMTDGPTQQRAKLALQQALASVDLASAADRTRTLGTALAGTTGMLTPWINALPTMVMGDLLGFEAARLPLLAQWMSDFVRAMSPLSNAAQLDAASDAARHLLRRFGQLVHDGGSSLNFA